MSTPPLRTLTCPTCGAPISFADQSREATCRFCGSVIERSDDAPTAHDETKALRIDMTGDHIRVDAPTSGTQGAHKFVIKMGQGGPMVIDMGDLSQSASVLSSSVFTSSSTSTSGPIRADVFSGSLPSTPIGSARPRRSGGGCGVVLGLLLVIGVIGVGAVLATGAGAWLLGSFMPGGSSDGPGLDSVIGDALDQVGSIGSNVVLNGDDAVVLGEGEQSGALVVPGTDYQASGDQTQALYAFDGATGKQAWKTEPFKKSDDFYQMRLVSDRDHVFAVLDRDLYAFRRSDGTLDWRASISDKLPYCDAPGCLAVIDGTVITLAADGVIQAFDPKNEGRELWRATLNNTPRQVFTLGTHAAVLDRDSNNNGVIRAFDVATGDETPLTAGCNNDVFDETLDDSPVLHTDAETGDLIVFYGSFGTCGTRFSAKTLKSTWDLNLGSDLRLEGYNTTLLDQGVFVGTTADALLIINTDAGELIKTVEVKDVDLTPFMIHDGHILALAKTTRGTTRFEIWSLALTTGEREWSYALGEAEPIDPPNATGSAAWDGDSRYSIQPLGDDLAVTVLTVSDKDGLTAQVSRLKLATGSSVSDKVLKLASPDTVTSFVLSSVSRINGRLVLADTSKIWWVDLESAEIVATHP